ncbi:hypothetical protein [Brachybacterium massiliense]|uniref:hypothetical protein n=1 Tax=Brachybacterium massiliense TaxID=1755098 RepID=UPI001BB09BF2|nr:hypothetical protein [Brachybacterium massiliense]
MIVRRGRAGVRLSGALLLAAACAAGPAAAQAAPAPGEISPLQSGAECEGVKPSVGVSSAEVAVGESVTITATCFTGRSAITGDVITPTGPQSISGTTAADGSFSANFTAQTEGEHAVSLTSGGRQATTAFTVTAGSEEEPTDPPEEEPTDPPEEPTDPEPTEPDPTEPEPTEPPEEEPTQPEDPDAEDPGDEDPDAEDPDGDQPAPGTGEDDGSEDSDDSAPSPGAGEDGGADDGTESGSGEETGSGTGDTGSGGEQGSEGPGPSAGEPTQPENDPPSPAPSSPGPDASDDPEQPSGRTAEQEEAAAHAAALTSLFAFGLSGGQMGTSPEDIGDPSGAGSATDGSGSGNSGSGASDGGGELAETGTEVSAAAGLAALSLVGGAGLLWHQRRRTR